MPRDRAATGAAGAFFVAGELSRQGWSAALTVGNIKRTDLLAQVDQLAAAIQVKTKSGHSRDFRLDGIRDYSQPNANEWVVLVALRDPGADYFVAPHDHVRATVEAFELLEKGRWVNLAEHEFGNYFNNWDLLKQPSWQVPWMVEDWVRDCAPCMSWPIERGPFPLGS